MQAIRMVLPTGVIINPKSSLLLISGHRHGFVFGEPPELLKKKVMEYLVPEEVWGAKRMTDTLREVIMPQFTRSVRYGKVPKVQQGIQITGISAGN